ncbi:MAG: sugar phosphate isomerase/epimerase [Acidimicrobiales bacterium]|nr:sugar phosphate isomerase/epimerase [Acidimicrobiales bacterium]
MTGSVGLAGGSPPGRWVPGLCSVTFRALAVPAVVDLAAEAGLEAIEWGGDVHVPPGDVRRAAAAAQSTLATGLRVGSYGSYLFAGTDLDADDVARTLDVVEALGAPWLRLWCPFGIEPGDDEADRAGVTAAVGAVAAAAHDRGVGVYLEFHGGTLTASAASARRLLDDVGAPNLACAWQPPYWAPEEPDAEAAAVGLLGADLAHLHVYAWEPDGTRRPLHSEADRWRRRLAAAGDALAAPANSAAAACTADAVHIDVARPHLALVEFVPGDDPACLADEVATLRAVLGG